MSTELNRHLNSAAMNVSSTNKRRTQQLEILCASRDGQYLRIVDALGAALPMAHITKRNITNGHADPLYGVERLPDLVVFFQGNEWIRELEEYGRRANGIRPPLVVVGKSDNPDALRAALKAGARDFLGENTCVEEIAHSLQEILTEIVAGRRGQSGNLVAVINAKGGCGASMLASNIACESAEVLGLQTLLVDMDVQFGNPGQYLDTAPHRGLLEALQMASSLDAMALEGYMIRHKSGLHILSTEGQGLFLPEDLAGDNLEKLLDLLTASYPQIIVDLPRHIDPITSTLLERADHVVMVAQQDIATLRDATRLMHILTADLGIPRNRINIVVNRFQANSEISLKDIARSLSCERVTAIPNDFRSVSESLNRAAPLHEIARGKAITRALHQLSETLTGTATNGKPGLLDRLRSWF